MHGSYGHIALFFGGSGTADDVTQHDREELPSADGHTRNGSVERKFLAVGTQADDDPRLAHRAGAGAGRTERPHVVAVRGVETLRNEALQRLTDGMGGIAAEYGFGGAVEYQDPAS